MKPENLQLDYGNIDNETKIAVAQRASEIRSLIRQTAQDIVFIGQKLTEVKEKLKHGNFRNWLKAEFNWSLSSATKFMQVSEQFKDVNFTNLNFSTSALYVLAAPSTPQAARKQAMQLASHGEQITYSLAKVIVTRYRDIYSQIEDEKTQSQSNLEESSSLRTIEVSAQADVDQTLERRDKERAEKEQLQNFKIIYADNSFVIPGKPTEITALFEQMQSNPIFAREIFAKAQLLLNSEPADLKTTRS